MKPFSPLEFRERITSQCGYTLLPSLSASVDTTEEINTKGTGNPMEDHLHEKMADSTAWAGKPKYAFLDRCRSERERHILSNVEEIMRAENFKQWKQQRMPVPESDHDSTLSKQQKDELSFTESYCDWIREGDRIWEENHREVQIMLINDFHAHLDACPKCRNHPFELCNVGANLLHVAVVQPVPRVDDDSTDSRQTKDIRQHEENPSSVGEVLERLREKAEEAD